MKTSLGSVCAESAMTLKKGIVLKTILVIDDEDALRSNLVEMLTLEGFRVVEARDGDEGLQCAQASPPDLILCDIAMPGMSGFDVLERLRQYLYTAEIPVIFLTARAENEAVQRATTLGGTGYIKKPFRLKEVLDAIRAQLDG
jgi:DNA-binding response OmpR family regulator